MHVPFFRPSLDSEESEAVQAVLASGWLSTGKVAYAFEQDMSAILSEGSDHALYTITVQNATAGLHLALLAMKLPSDCVVLTTPYTFASTVNSIIYAGLQFKLVDIDKNGYLINPESCIDELAHNSQIGAIMPVLLAGDSRDYSQLYAIAKNKGVKIIEDAAHAFPARREQGYLGTYGDIGVYSFYGNKTITTGEGGMIVCHDRDVYDDLMCMRQNGFEVSPYGRTTNEKSWHEKYDIKQLGYKYNMPDILAAIGRVQLKKSKTMHAKRAHCVKTYASLLKECPFLSVPTFDSKTYTRHSWHLFIIRFTNPKLDRDTIMSQLFARGIQCSIHYKPIHLHSYYRDRYKLDENDYPHATESYRCSLSLPLFPDMTESEIHYVCNTLIEVCKNLLR